MTELKLLERTGMKWRDAVKLAVARRLYAAVANRSGREPEWDGPACDQGYWLEAAAGAIAAVREGAKDVHVNVVFEVSDETFRIKAEVNGDTQLETGAPDPSDGAL